MTESNNQWTVTGVVSSAANGNCHENDFALFAQVPVFVIWIREVLEAKKIEVKNVDHAECTFYWHNEYK